MTEQHRPGESAVESSLRLYDANLNRASEGLRVAEDVCRFHLDLPGIATELKELRHHLLSASTGPGLSRQELLQARNIEGDVGRDVPSPGCSSEPVDLCETAFRNLRRAAESIRVLEEVSRSRAEDAAVLQGLRYRVYSVEKTLMNLAGDRTELLERLEKTSVCLLATAAACVQGELLSSVERCIAAGVGMVQLREKRLADEELLECARRLRELCAGTETLFIVNDRPDIALLSHADGVHLGQEDLPLPQVRRIVGERLLVGVSTHSLEQAREAVREGADYIGAGPVFETTTKDAGPLLGTDGLEAILGQVQLPVFAIGGIMDSNVAGIQGAGGGRVAVCSSVLGSETPAKIVEQLCSALA
ncbi:MAG: thiamine phosphate synthase [Planctomycetota bacterium]|nr:thiamine phosphate synthase [Planctomycetota bacterium]